MPIHIQSRRAGEMCERSESGLSADRYNSQLMTWDKPKVEVAVQVVERWILARLRHQTFFSLADLNRAIGGLLKDLNHRPFKNRRGTRVSKSGALILPALSPLRAQLYHSAEGKLPRAHIDYHVEIDGHYYSAPHAPPPPQVEVRITATTVEIFHQNQ